MDAILEEMFTLHKAGAKQIELPRRRLPEFLMDATEHRFLTMEELEKFRQTCLRGEARAWGIPVTFVQTLKQSRGTEKQVIG